MALSSVRGRSLSNAPAARFIRANSLVSAPCELFDFPSEVFCLSLSSSLSASVRAERLSLHEAFADVSLQFLQESHLTLPQIFQLSQSIQQVHRHYTLEEEDSPYNLT